MIKNIPVYDIRNFRSYKNDGIDAHRFGIYAKQNQHLHKAHKHSFYHMAFFTQGKGKHQIDFNTFDIIPNQIYFMSPGQVHHWEFEDEEPDGYLINFSTSFFSNFLLKQDYLHKFNFFAGDLNDQVVNLDRLTSDKIIFLFEEILKQGDQTIDPNDDYVRILLLLIMTEVAKSSATLKVANSQYNNTILNNYRRLIEENYKDLRLPKHYAALLHITPNHLNALCNDFLGTSAGDLIRDRILLEAKRLLINLDLRVAEVAEKLNFADQSYFVKFFKKYEHITPDKFRKQYTLRQYGKE